MTLLKATYLQNYNAKIAARIGFLHAWSLTERQCLKKFLHRLKTMQFWQKSTLKKRFDSILRILVTSDFIVPWWCRRDRFTRTCLPGRIFTGVDWLRPGLSSTYHWLYDELKEHSDPKFREAVDMQWENIDKCINDTIYRDTPDFTLFWNGIFRETEIL